MSNTNEKELPKLYLIEDFEQDEIDNYACKFSGVIHESGHDFKNLKDIAFNQYITDEDSEEDEEECFDWNPYQLGDSKFSIVWFIAADPVKAVNYLIDKLPNKGSIGLEPLLNCYQNYLERFHIIPEDTEEAVGYDFYNQLVELFEDSVKRLPNAPKNNIWEEVDEYISK